MPTATGTPNLLEPELLERWHEAHKAIAGRLRIDRIYLQNVSALKAGVLDCSADEFLAEAHTSKLTFHEHAYE